MKKKDKNLLLFLAFILFIFSGHSFWPYEKREKDNKEGLSRSKDPKPSEKSVQKSKIGDGAENTIISQDTIWEGVIEVNSVVLVKKGARLTIKPGTELIFSGPRGDTDDVHIIQGGGIKVEGQIHASGTAEEPIVFTGKEKRPGGWGKIQITYSQDNIFKYCIFEYANYAIHTHFSSLTISHCLFENNNEGCRLGFSQSVIENSIFRLNEFRGINFRAGKHEIRNNSIVANRVGIFVYEKGARSKIFSNNIFNNQEYDLRLGDFNKEDMETKNNFWGTGEKTGQNIYDRDEDDNIGQVVIHPVEKEIRWEDEMLVKGLR